MLGKMQGKEIAPEKRKERSSRKTYLSLYTHYIARSQYDASLAAQAHHTLHCCERMSICESCVPPLAKRPRTGTGEVAAGAIETRYFRLLRAVAADLKYRILERSSFRK
jgi:hypothetical protein